MSSYGECDAAPATFRQMIRIAQNKTAKGAAVKPGCCLGERRDRPFRGCEEVFWERASRSNHRPLPPVADNHPRPTPQQISQAAGMSPMMHVNQLGAIKKPGADSARCRVGRRRPCRCRRRRARCGRRPADAAGRRREHRSPGGGLIAGRRPVLEAPTSESTRRWRHSWELRARALLCGLATRSQLFRQNLEAVLGVV
jgi:hypothetical protein